MGFVGNAIAYASWLAVSGLLLAAFYALYTFITPWDDMALIRDGNVGCAASLAGALVGFSLTLASSISHNDTLLTSVFWSLGAMAVQLVAYAITAHMLGARHGVADGNTAAGIFMAGVSLAVGAINAACLT